MVDDMIQPSFKIEPIAECSLLVTFSINSKTTETEQRVGHISDAIRFHFSDVIMNVTPAYYSILVDYLPYRISESEFILKLTEVIKSAEQIGLSNTPSELITLPVYYAHETGIDIERFEQNGISLDELIKLHTQPEYTVSAIGFAPGFGFLSDVPIELTMPRHNTPRVSVAKGSVAIANTKTAVYPSDSPGGWNIIGNCPIPLFELDKLNHLNSEDSFKNIDSISKLKIGSRVKFKAVSRDDFLSLGGLL
ncbi:allophanate hydrolase subunit 1 [Vibrio gallaecicus]|nr:allophanate hydrolase subunit 1 [Vibrio gallaecicus]MDN3617069.1 allophanate hydrolase subunit 1 [Vibrio gallaecicus]